MDLNDAARLITLYAHLLLCVFALYDVLSLDWRVLRGRASARRLFAAHRRLSVLLAALWLTGLTMVVIDHGADWAGLADQPKMLTKFLCVTVLSLNALVLRYYCLPRLAARQPLSPAESTLLFSFGALSTANWLAAAFFGIGRVLSQWTLAANVALYVAGLLVALLAGMLLRRLARWVRPPVPNNTGYDSLRERNTQPAPLRISR